MIYFTSDNHFYHVNVIRYCNRPFSSVEHMNEIMVNNWNSVVGPSDIVYHLGDFSMAFRSIELYTRRLNGVKYLVPGNHDFCHSFHKKSRTEENRNLWINKYESNGWIILPEQTTIDLDDIGTVNLCHLPYQLTHSADDKYNKWRPNDDGRWLLCGHIHQNWKVKDNMINVGVDVWDHKPVSIKQIKEIIDEACNLENT
jgi:calcineurin-like phosphoesterase family protein